MNIAALPRRSDRALAQEMAGSLVLLNPETGQYYRLDEVGARIWELCDGARSVSDIVGVLCDEYDAPPATVEADTRDLLAELAGERLVLDAVGAP